MPDSFDVAVIGGGPGGYVAAIRAAQLGGRVAIAEKDRLGGTCLVKGCIPTKALLQSSELYSLVANEGRRFGVVAESVRFDMNAAQERRVQVVDQLVKGVESLLKAAGVEVLRGHGRLEKPGRFSVDGQAYQAGNALTVENEATWQRACTAAPKRRASRTTSASSSCTRRSRCACRT